MTRRKTPLFRPGERPPYPDAFRRLPVVMHIGGLPVRWVGPLVEIGHDVTLAELGRAAWQRDDEAPWRWRLEQAGPAITPTGRIRARFGRAFAQAVRAIGWGSRVDEWTAWLAFEWSGVHDVVRDKASRRGVEQAWSTSAGYAGSLEKPPAPATGTSTKATSQSPVVAGTWRRAQRSEQVMGPSAQVTSTTPQRLPDRPLLERRPRTARCAWGPAGHVPLRDGAPPGSGDPKAT